jgi:hypothetical protein
MLKDDNKYLHDLIRILIDTEMAVINGQYEQAYLLLGQLKRERLDEFFSDMRANVRDKIFELHGDKV